MTELFEKYFVNVEQAAAVFMAQMFTGMTGKNQWYVFGISVAAGFLPPYIYSDVPAQLGATYYFPALGLIAASSFLTDYSISTILLGGATTVVFYGVLNYTLNIV